MLILPVVYALGGVEPVPELAVFIAIMCFISNKLAKKNAPQIKPKTNKWKIVLAVVIIMFVFAIIGGGKPQQASVPAEDMPAGKNENQ